MHTALRCLLTLSSTLIFVIPFVHSLPAWGEYKLNSQYPPWPSRPCADYGAYACFRPQRRKDSTQSKGLMVCDPGTEMWLPCLSCDILIGGALDC
ncbi:hypothetical protein GcC1_208015 [Golovinomyces cichoracearum]|uniref:Secreted protein n=1 Tax=Golovinomyces cichoracearum TaxID=62708 RepID=A0A420HBS7_9PEZI|nr:hypothetical protein GcC1_208015 [Golovinomyces cichoracearum]